VRQHTATRSSRLLTAVLRLVLGFHLQHYIGSTQPLSHRCILIPSIIDMVKTRSSRRRDKDDVVIVEDYDRPQKRRKRTQQSRTASPDVVITHETGGVSLDQQAAVSPPSKLLADQPAMACMLCCSW
jgi:hypothetical protein